LVDYFEHLKYGLCFILVFIGVELIAADHLKLTAQMVCVVIISVFTICIIASILQRSSKGRPQGKLTV